MADRDGERDRRVRELMNNNKKDNNGDTSREQHIKNYTGHF